MSGKKIIGYKKVHMYKAHNREERSAAGWLGWAILTLEIPAGAKRVMSNKRKQRASHLYDDKCRKCRASRAKVIAAETIRGGPIPDGVTFVSEFDIEFTYEVGKTHAPRDAPFNPDERAVCGSGIHFFRTKREAEEYVQ